MNENIKIIQDISLLYELSLAVGSSLLIEENCHHFIRILSSRKDLSYASIWIKNQDDRTDDNSFRLVYGNPVYRIQERNIAADHYLIKKLADQPFFSHHHLMPEFHHLVQEKNIKKGAYGIFSLGNLGFIKILDLKREAPFSAIELGQLKDVFDKFKVSLEGGLAYEQLRKESAIRKKIQAELKESNIRLADTFDNMNDALILLDREGKITEANKAAIRLLDYWGEGNPQINVQEIIHPEDMEKARIYFREVREKGSSGGFECRILTRNQETKYIQVNSSAFFEKGEFIGSRDIVRDITEQKKAQEAIKASEFRLRQIIDTSLDAVITINSKGKIIEWNQQAEKMFGFTREEVLNKPLHETIMPKRHRPAHQEGIKHFLRTGEGPALNNRIEVMALRRSGEEFPIELSITAIHNGEDYVFSAFLRDITEQKEVQEAIRKSEEKYRGILENMELGLMEVDKEDRIVKAYDRFCKMTGYTPEELIGKNATAIFLPKEFRPVMAQQNSDRLIGKAAVYEIQLKKKNGNRIWVLISGAPIVDQEGKVIGSLGIHYDITERKQLERDLAAAKQSAEQARLAEQQFLANMSHEIRTPMNAVIGMTHLLYESQPTEPQKEYLDALGFAADSLMGIINNILDLSKIEAGELEFEAQKFSLSQLLESLKQTFQLKVKDKPVSVVINFDAEINNLVVGDPVRVNQILSNLLGNASKFTLRGTIGVIARCLKKEKDQYLIELVVHDTGIGIPEDKIDTIFQNFKQANKKITREFGGTGLGLAIVRQLVDLQGGTIMVKSKPGKGSTFSVILPFGNSNEAAVTKKRIREKVDQETLDFLSRLKVLVVEDNTLNQKLIQQILDNWGCKSFLSVNGMEALKSSRAQAFDIILMDINMPEMDGCEATATIRSEAGNPNRQTPIIALTAAALLDEKKRAIKAGMNEFLPKPFSPKRLQNLILGILGFQKKDEDQEREGSGAPSSRITIDLSRLHEFCNEDKVFIKDILQTFLKETPASLHSLEHALKQGAFQKVYDKAHSLKPNLGILGLIPQQQLATEIETLAKVPEPDIQYMEQLFRQLSSEIEQAFPLLEEQANSL